MQRGPWTRQAEERRRQRQRRRFQNALNLAPFVLIAALTGALGVWFFLSRADFATPPNQPTQTSLQRPSPMPTHFGTCRSELDRDCIVDGDTFRLGTEKMRIANIDAPETHTNLCGGTREVDLGRKATRRLHELMNKGALDIQRGGRDIYGRTLVIVRSGTRDVGETLIAEHLARRWPDGDEFWCVR